MVEKESELEKETGDLAEAIVCNWNSEPWLAFKRLIRYVEDLEKRVATLEGKEVAPLEPRQTPAQTDTKPLTPKQQQYLKMYDELGSLSKVANAAGVRLPTVSESIGKIVRQRC